MDLKAIDPDIDTIFNRIKNDEWNLQPDFQRGEVWSLAKKQRLIDSLLRGWHVPPIHLIQVEGTSGSGCSEVVLDGQQRLTAIRDFRKGVIVVNGFLPPHDDVIASLNGVGYDDLPEDVKRRFNRQSIRVFTITNYLPEEPGELFFRLNQPTNLTTAEQRNAFFGPVRAQIKELVSRLAELKVDEKFLGFSNSRMAYDDVIARVANTLQLNSLRQKVTAYSVSEMYRSKEPLPPNVTGPLKSAIQTLGTIREYFQNEVAPEDIRFNKATLHTLLLMLTYAKPNLHPNEVSALATFVIEFERARAAVKPGTGPLSQIKLLRNVSFFKQETRWVGLLHIYNDRAASRVSDVSSVILRDAAIWIFAALFPDQLPLSEQQLTRAKALSQIVLSTEGFVPAEESLTGAIEAVEWGESL